MNYTANTDFSFSGAQSVTWSRTYSSPSSVTWNQSGDNISTYFFATGQYERFSLTASNVCGSISNDYGFSSKDCSGGGGGGCLSYQVSPNPATNSIQVSVTPNIPAPCDPPPCCQATAQTESSTSLQATNTTDKSIQIVSIYDNKGTLRMERKYNADNKHATLNISKLPAGVYFVRITDGNFSENHQIIVGK
ncbi:MAG TPA: T9SS type A sorting domain-containing protein [Hanamia sp.]|nr:T9SS type A sorting domain-containing protein [Hanamia sp.]